MRLALYALATLLGGCVVYQTPPPAPVQPPPEAYPPQAEAPPAEAPPEDAPAVSVNIDPPVVQPAPIVVGWAPPPLLVEVPPPTPFVDAVWVGGYWVWQGNWVWAHGHWMAPPRPDYMWVHPYYEHRGDTVIFIDGHWSARGVVFVPPPPGLRLEVERPAYGVIPGARPIGPEGCFVPAPPGSRAGIIIPAPVGTAPAVVTSAPAVIAPGMRITNNVTTVNNVTNVTNVTRVTNVTIVAPPGATKNGRAFDTMVPAAPHLAAGRPALVQARAPEPVSTRPLPVYTPGSRPPSLPQPPPMHAQPVSAQPMNAGTAPGRPGEREHGSPHTAPGTAIPPEAAHPMPTAFGHDQGHGNADSARSERPYSGGYEHQGSPQAQGDPKALPQPQNANQNGYHPAPQPQPQQQPQNGHGNGPQQQPQGGHGNAPQPQPQGGHGNAPQPQPQNGHGNAPQQQPQNGHGNAPQQQSSQHQGAPASAPAHAQGDNRSHKADGQSEHDGKHGQGNDH